MNELFEKLEYAKEAVLASLNNENTMTDFHDIVYWAGEVVRLRAEIRKML